MTYQNLDELSVHIERCIDSTRNFSVWRRKNKSLGLDDRVSTNETASPGMPGRTRSVIHKVASSGCRQLSHHGSCDVSMAHHRTHRIRLDKA